jgi:hypothetical protein
MVLTAVSECGLSANLCRNQHTMATNEMSQEERILRMVKRVLTDIAKDTSTPPGMKHPLSDKTIQGIRDCLSLISSREKELAEGAGRPSRSRPEFIDEPKKSQVLTFHKPKKKNPDDEPTH